MPAVSVHHTATVDESWDGPGATAAMPNDSTVLRYCHAWYDPNGDPDDKTTWKFPHAKSKGGPANLSACRNGLARLSSANIPSKDTAGVRAHLQAHLDDAKKSEGKPMNTKTLSRVTVKDAAKGEVTAVFATLNSIDSDGDVTLPSAFEEGCPVRISAYGHQSWQGALPVGKGTIRTVGNEAILDGQFFMNTAHGRDTFEVVKELGSQQEWSYGYDPVEFHFGEFEGKQVRFLAKQKVHEVSPVLLGAGVGTRVLAAKALASAGVDPASAMGLVRKPGKGIDVHETPVVSRSWDATFAVKGIDDNTRPSELRTVYAWCDPDGDPERKSSYRLPHHHGVDGPANLRAIVAGIALLNSDNGAGIPENDRKAVYDHLAAHMRDADTDPPEYRTGSTSALKFYDHGTAVLATVSSFIDRASEVMALRAKKGKGLAPASADLIAWIDDDLRRLKALLENPQLAAEEPLRDQEISTLMAAVASVHGI